jgi:hypothetical protein
MTALPDRFQYTADGHSYTLSPIGKLTPFGWRVISADMYNMQGHYVGEWMRREMPLRLIRDLEKHLKYMALWGVPTDGSDWLDDGNWD